MFKKCKTIDETQCSCGIKNLWETRKSSEKNFDMFNYDETKNAIPARHSKSLDQLQFRAKNNLNYSLGNIFHQPNHQSSTHTNGYDTKLKNVASEHNMRYRQRGGYKFDNFEECNCSSNYNYFNIIKKPQNTTVINLDESSVDIDQIEADILNKKYKQFSIKSISNKQKNQIIKSLSHTPTETSQNIFRSNSVQFISPNKHLENGFAKCHSLSRTSKKIEINGLGNQNDTIIKQGSKTRFEIGSTSSSTESLSIKNLTGSSSNSSNSETCSNTVVGVRKVRSTSCLGGDSLLPLLSGTESLPNITPKPEKHCSYPELKFYTSSSSSTTSEQSGWITSRSSSIASSTDVPTTSALLANIESIQRKILSLPAEFRRSRRERKGKKRGDSINRFHKKYNSKYDREFSLNNKGKLRTPIDL